MRNFSPNPEKIEQLKKEIKNAQAIVIGAGAGLSTAAGLTYSGERFEKYFYDFAARFGINNIYAGGFYPFPKEEIRWAWWARHIYFNRYIDPHINSSIVSVRSSRPQMPAQCRGQ